MKKFFIQITLVLGTAFCGSAMANESVLMHSSGELSPVLSCFYDCKPGPKMHRRQTWQEVTNLAVLNADTGLKKYQYSFDPRDPLDQYLDNVNTDLTPLWTKNLDSISTAEGSGTIGPNPGNLSLTVTADYAGSVACTPLKKVNVGDPGLGVWNDTSCSAASPQRSDQRISDGDVLILTFAERVRVVNFIFGGNTVDFNDTMSLEVDGTLVPALTDFPIPAIFNTPTIVNVGEEGTVFKITGRPPTSGGPSSSSNIDGFRLTGITIQRLSGPDANVLFSDGNENILGRATLNLSFQDLDMIDVCRTLQNAGLPVPRAGLVEIYLSDMAPGGIYGWVKNLFGKFYGTKDESPDRRRRGKKKHYDDTVSAIAKTGCRVVPPEVAMPVDIDEKFLVSGAPDNVPLILIESTDDAGNNVP